MSSTGLHGHISYYSLHGYVSSYWKVWEDGNIITIIIVMKFLLHLLQHRYHGQQYAC